MHRDTEQLTYSLAASQPRSLAASQPRSLAASQPRSLAAKDLPIYVGAQHSRKYLIYSMNTLKPAIATTACAGIRRMEAGQPPALGMRTCGGKGAGQWLLVMGFAKREHPSVVVPSPKIEASVCYGLQGRLGNKVRPIAAERFEQGGRTKTKERLSARNICFQL